MRYTPAPRTQAVRVVPRKYLYLDLASGAPEKKAGFEDLNFKDLPAVVSFIDLVLNENIKLVKLGDIKIFNKNLLRAQGACGKMVFFPDFPKEIQLVIFTMAAEEEPRPLRMIEMEVNGVRFFMPIGSPRPAIFKASKYALNALASGTLYKLLFALKTPEGTSKNYYFNPRIDFVRIDAFAHHDNQGPPKLILLDSLVIKSHLDQLLILSMGLGCLLGMNWGKDNIATMKNLCSLHLTSTFVDPARNDRALTHLTLEALHGPRGGFVPVCERADKTYAFGMFALNLFFQNIPGTDERQRICDLWRMLERFQESNNIPRLLELIFEYIPVPGLAAAPAVAPSSGSD